MTPCPLELGGGGRSEAGRPRAGGALLVLAGTFVKKGPKRAPRPRSPGGGEPPGSLAESRPGPTLTPAQRGLAGGGSSPDVTPGTAPVRDGNPSWYVAS